MINIKRRVINHKGLTLVELLAVIVVLGIVAAIAVPSMLKVMQDMRDRAFIANAWNMKEATDFYIKQETTSGTGARDKITYKELVDHGYMTPFEDPDTDKELPLSDHSYVVIQNNTATAVCVKGVIRNLCTKEEVETPIEYSDLKPSLIVKNAN